MPVPVGDCKEVVIKMPLWQLLPECDLSNQPGSPGGCRPLLKDRASLVQQPLLLLWGPASAIPVSLEGLLQDFLQPPFSPRTPKAVLYLPSFLGQVGRCEPAYLQKINPCACLSFLIESFL